MLLLQMERVPQPRMCRDVARQIPDASGALAARLLTRLLYHAVTAQLPLMRERAAALGKAIQAEDGVGQTVARIEASVDAIGELLA
ncbi:MAG: hypothetical protein M3R61_01080 [Chloroflexota bacterium]|nr:hypothetical protein [Chloroflexota bacterium]